MVDLKELRNRVGLTQLELSEKVGVSENTIQNWESGKTCPKGDNFKRYLDALEIKNKSERKRIAGEIAGSSASDSTEVIDNIPYFLFDEDSNEINRIKECYASAEDLDMLGYANYVSFRGKYANLERRGDARFLLEFAFFEKFGGFNATMKKLADSRSRLGGLYNDALEFGEKHPGEEYRLVSFDRSEIIVKIYEFLGRSDYKNNLKDLYNSLKIIEKVLDDSFPASKAIDMLKYTDRINEIIRNYHYSMWNVEKSLGYLSGYVELNEDDVEGVPNIKNLSFTKRGKQFIKWFDDDNNRRFI